jgi:nucleotide-binding universal stress UspA family protein
LLAIDGEPHTAAAIDWALNLAGLLQVGLVAVHVADPYLEQFADELYAQGRQAYREHVGRCLDQIATEAVAAFEQTAQGHAVVYEVKIRHGALVEELLAELAEGDYGLLVLGKQRLTGVRRRLARNLSQKVTKSRPGIPILVVPEGD